MAQGEDIADATGRQDCGGLAGDGRATVAAASCPGACPGASSGEAARAWQAVPREAAARSIWRLAHLRPDLSSATLLWRWQRQALVAMAIVLSSALVLAPAGLAVILTLLLAIPFFSVYLLRVLAAGMALERARTADQAMTPASHLTDADCPTYAVLVPLYDEAEVVSTLVAALSAIDYPQNRLAIRFVVEEDDLDTHAALHGMKLPPHMRVLMVPRGEPRTKPRALVVALDQTPGELVVVYDAEDLPQPDQLRHAAGVFKQAPDKLACLQACLNTFNPDETWLTRQFTIEYSALFDLILPALQRYGLPLPLGGTSNHFRRAALERVLAWDPYNVTEDADLGVRIARFGMRVGVIGSTTWEEAPPTLRIWLGQRTRWLKGWMQTYLVHMRQPARLVHELGWWPFLGLQALMGSMIASALVHPWFYVLLGYEAYAGTLLVADTDKSRLLWLLALANLVLGYLSVVIIGAVAVWARGRRRLILCLPLVPFYWLAISLAAYKAVIELATAPFHWEKTRHRGWPLQPRRESRDDFRGNA